MDDFYGMRFLSRSLLRLGYISPEDFSFCKILHDVRAAAAEILQFLQNLPRRALGGERFVVRVNHQLSKNAIAELNEKFADIVLKGEIIQGPALHQKDNEPEIWELPRLILTPYRNRFGRLRQLIDAINSSSLA